RVLRVDDVGGEGELAELDVLEVRAGGGGGAPPRRADEVPSGVDRILDVPVAVGVAAIVRRAVEIDEAGGEPADRAAAEGADGRSERADGVLAGEGDVHRDEGRLARLKDAVVVARVLEGQDEGDRRVLGGRHLGAGRAGQAREGR